MSAPASAYAQLLDALHEHGSKVNGNGVKAQAQCPAHDDTDPSLTVTSIEGQALVYCHAGCATADVLAALGLGMGALFDEPAGARYNTDRTGTVLRTVHRSTDKKFHQTGQTKGTAPLYRLPAVIAAVAADTVIFVTEGEKDVHALESVGAVATCSPMGASNAARADWTPLTGAHVVIVPDRDEAGQRYIRDVVTLLDGKAATLRVKLPAVGNDAADHVAAGHGLTELVETNLPAVPDAVEQPVDNAPPGRTLKLTAASTIVVRPVHWLFDKRIPLGEVTLLGGRRGTVDLPGPQARPARRVGGRHRRRPAARPPAGRVDAGRVRRSDGRGDARLGRHCPRWSTRSPPISPRGRRVDGSLVPSKSAPVTGQRRVRGVNLTPAGCRSTTSARPANGRAPGCGRKRLSRPRSTGSCAATRRTP